MAATLERHLFWGVLPRGEKAKPRLVLEATPGRLRLIAPRARVRFQTLERLPQFTYHMILVLVGMVLSAVVTLADPVMTVFAIPAIMVVLGAMAVLTYYVLNLRAWRFVVRSPLTAHDVRVVEARAMRSGVCARLILKQSLLESKGHQQTDNDFEITSGFRDRDWVTIRGIRKRIKAAFDVSGQLVAIADK